jgi:hypothetical protein
MAYCGETAVLQESGRSFVVNRNEQNKKDKSQKSDNLFKRYMR